MTLKHILEIATRSSIIAASVMLTQYSGLWGTADETDILLKCIMENADLPKQLAKLDQIPLPIYLRFSVKPEKGIAKCNEEAKTNIGLRVLAPEMFEEVAINANKWKADTLMPMINKLKLDVKEISFSAFLTKLQFPEAHVEGDQCVNRQLKGAEDIPLGQQQDAQQKQEKKQSEAQEQQKNVATKDEDLGFLLGALAESVDVLTLKRRV